MIIEIHQGALTKHADFEGQVFATLERCRDLSLNITDISGVNWSFMCIGPDLPLLVGSDLYH